MDDLISRQAAIDEIEERKYANGYRNVAVISELNRLEGYIMRLPSAQPERKTGRWVKVDKKPYFRKHFDRVCCSACRAEGMSRWNFCPNCGTENERRIK